MREKKDDILSWWRWKFRHPESTKRFSHLESRMKEVPRRCGTQKYSFGVRNATLKLDIGQNMSLKSRKKMVLLRQQN